MESQPINATKRIRGKILIVEDEVIIREFVSEILEMEGFETLMMENADKARTYLDVEVNRNQVALLLTDILMPGSINGAELANLSHSEWPQIPVMIMSGHETPESSGVKNHVEFVRKPWTMGQLLDGVVRALEMDESAAIG